MDLEISNYYILFEFKPIDELRYHLDGALHLESKPRPISLGAVHLGFKQQQESRTIALLTKGQKCAAPRP